MLEAFTVHGKKSNKYRIAVTTIYRLVLDPHNGQLSVISTTGRALHRCHLIVSFKFSSSLNISGFFLVKAHVVVITAKIIYTGIQALLALY